jgi:hypothetical protein
MMTDTALRILYLEAHNFLKEQAGEDFMGELGDFKPTPRANNMKQIFYRLIESLIATRTMRETVGEIALLADVLLQFNPKKTYKFYGNDVAKLLNEIKAKHDSWEIGSYARWEVFCKGLLSGASFLSRLGSAKTFNQFVCGFKYNEKTMAVLPLLLQKEIRGLKFPMACSFLHSVGYTDYIAPDRHMRDLLHEIWVTETWENYEALKALIKIARVNDVKPVVVHEIFTILSSDKISEDAIEPYKHRRDFVRHITPILDRFIES